MDIYAIDPGPKESAIVVYEPKRDIVRLSNHQPNDQVLRFIKSEAETFTGDVLVIEQIVSYGMAIGGEVIETAFWSGRFYEAWEEEHERVERLDRKHVKKALCGVTNARAAEVRDAILQRYGGRQNAIGSKKAPGPLYGVTNHKMAALAVALAWWDINGKEVRR